MEEVVISDDYDFRKKTKDGFIMSKNQSLFVVVHKHDMGTNGPYFYTKHLAIVYAFYTVSLDKLLANQAKKEETEIDIEDLYDQHSNYILLEVRPENDMKIDAKIFPFNAIRRRCREETFTKLPRTDVFLYNREWPLRFVKDISYAIERKQGLERGKLDFDKSITKLLSWLIRVQYVANTPRASLAISKHLLRIINKDNVYENLSFNGIWACRPQELFIRSATYTVNWVKIFRLFILSKSQSKDLMLFVNNLQKIVDHLVGPRDEVMQVTIKNRLIVYEIIKNLTDIKDVVATCSVNRLFRRTCGISMVQNLIRQKFHPSIKEFFTGSTDIVPVYTIGYPRKGSSGSGLWRCGLTFFREDFPSFDKQGTEIEYPRNLLDIIRNTSSFISMWAAMKSVVMKNRIVDLTLQPINQETFAAGRFRLVPNTLRLKYSASKPIPQVKITTAEQMMAPASELTPSIFEITLHSIKNITKTSSWLHLYNIPDMFRTPGLEEKVNTLKEFEVSRLQLLKSWVQKQDPNIKEIIEKDIINSLTISRLGSILCGIRIEHQISTLTGTYEHVMYFTFKLTGLSKETLLFINRIFPSIRNMPWKQQGGFVNFVKLGNKNTMFHWGANLLDIEKPDSENMVVYFSKLLSDDDHLIEYYSLLYTIRVMYFYESCDSFVWSTNF